MVDGSGHCDKPDRDWHPNPDRPWRKPSRCGYPMPCPYHTFVLDAVTGEIVVPRLATPDQTEKVKQIRDALKGKV